MKTRLLSEKELEWSTTVANNLMNRERVAFGVNSYAKEIGLNPVEFLTDRKKQDYIQWTDLCCGSGNALIQTLNHFKETELAGKLSLTGMDLVDFFSGYETNDILKLRQMNLSHWNADRKNDLITIVHGLHYIGNKMAVVVKAAAALKKDGIFIGNLDLDNIVIQGIENAKKLILAFFKKNGIIYNQKNKILKIAGSKIIKPQWVYLGADDKAGSNYTRQEAVSSYYKLI